MSENTDFPFGYTTDKKGNKSSRKRYGYSAQAAKSFAEKRLKKNYEIVHFYVFITISTILL